MVVRLKITKKNDTPNLPTELSDTSNLPKELFGIHVKRREFLLGEPDIEFIKVNYKDNFALSKHTACAQTLTELERRRAQELMVPKEERKRIFDLYLHLHFIVKCNQKDRKELESLLKKTKYRKYLNIRFISLEERSSRLNKLRLALNDAGFAMTIVSNFRQPKKRTIATETKKKLMPPAKFYLSQVQKEKLIPPPKFDLSQVQTENPAQTPSLIEKPAMKPINQQNQPTAEESKLTPRQPVQEENENSIVSTIQYTKALANHLLQKKAVYAAYSFVFDEKNQFHAQLKSIYAALKSGNNTPNLDQSLLQMDFTMTEHEIALLKSLIGFLQTKLYVPGTEDTKFTDLHREIGATQAMFSSSYDKVTGQALIAQHKKCIAAISILNAKIKPIFSECESFKTKTMEDINDVKTSINTQYDCLDDAIKRQLDKNSFINDLTNIESDLNSSEVPFYEMIAKLIHVFDQFTEKKQEAIQRLIPPCSAASRSTTPSTGNLSLLENDSFRQGLAKLEEKKQALSQKHENIMRGLTPFFFRGISQQKQKALSDILENYTNIKQITDDSTHKANLQALKTSINTLHLNIDNHMPILTQYRGLFRGKTDSDRLALNLKEEASNLVKTLDSFTVAVQN